MPVPTLALLSSVELVGALPAVLVAYLVGSVPFGLLLVRLFKGIDIRSVGSGNIGATNAARAGGRAIGLAVFACDLLKGWVAPALFAAHLAPLCGGTADDVTRVACGAAAVLGHCFPVYLGFRGGKGVATGCGALVALDWHIFLWGGSVWLAAAALTRFAGLASLLMGLGFAIAAWRLHAADRPELVVGAALLLLLILVRHRSNISRMLSGTEPRMFARKDPEGGVRA